MLYKGTFPHRTFEGERYKQLDMSSSLVLIKRRHSKEEDNYHEDWNGYNYNRPSTAMKQETGQVRCSTGWVSEAYRKARLYTA